jgi:uncharacterized membrane protein
MRRDHPDLLAVMGLAVVAVAIVLLPASLGPVRSILAVPLVLVLPGYALQAMVFPTRGVGIVARAVFTLGLSLAVAAVGGFVLNWTPAGLRSGPWALWLGAVTLGAALVALRRRGPDVARPVWPAIGLQPRQWLLGGLAVVLVVAAYVIASVGAAQPTTTFTQLWILPDGGATNAVRLGVRSAEASPLTYRLQLKVDGQVVREWPAIRLAPREQWTTEAPLPAGVANPGPIEAVLYRADGGAQPYRHVALWPDPQGRR